MSDPTCCPYCGGTNFVYDGIDDGLGPYGDAVGDIYYCEDCDMQFEGYIIPYSTLLGDEGSE